MKKKFKNALAGLVISISMAGCAGGYAIDSNTGVKEYNTSNVSLEKAEAEMKKNCPRGYNVLSEVSIFPFVKNWNYSCK